MEGAKGKGASRYYTHKFCRDKDPFSAHQAQKLHSQPTINPVTTKLYCSNISARLKSLNSFH
jgi:hypothetical protein